MVAILVLKQRDGSCRLPAGPAFGPTLLASPISDGPGLHPRTCPGIGQHGRKHAMHVRATSPGVWVGW